MTRNNRRIIGIDPGLASTGWGVLDCSGKKIRYAGHGSIETKAGRPQAERLFSIMEALRAVLDAYKPGEAAVETLYFGKNVSSAIPVAEARGVIFAALQERGLKVHEFRPNEIKQGVTGTVGADKRQVQEMVKIILGLPEIPKPDHAADALGAALCAAHSGGIAAALASNALASNALASNASALQEHPDSKTDAVSLGQKVNRHRNIKGRRSHA